MDVLGLLVGLEIELPKVAVEAVVGVVATTARISPQPLPLILGGTKGLAHPRPRLAITAEITTTDAITTITGAITTDRKATKIKEDLPVTRLVLKDHKGLRSPKDLRLQDKMLGQSPTTGGTMLLSNNPSLCKNPMLDPPMAIQGVLVELWKCASMFVLHFLRASLALVCQDVLNGALLKNRGFTIFQTEQNNGLGMTYQKALSSSFHQRFLFRPFCNKHV